MENERRKTLEIEDEYRRFAKEAQRERDRLSQELKLIKEDSKTDISSLQRSLIQKQQEYLEVMKASVVIKVF